MKVEKPLRNVNALPAALPNIDFAAYNKVSVPGMVESFEQKYKALQVPYPSDQGSLKGESYLGCIVFFSNTKMLFSYRGPSQGAGGCLQAVLC